MIKNGRGKRLLSKTYYGIVLIYILFLVIISTCSQMDISKDGAYSHSSIFYNSRRYQQSVANNPDYPKPPSRLSRKSQTDFIPSNLKVPETKRKKGKSTTERFGMSNKGRRKQHHLKSFNNEKFWEQDFDMTANQKAISEPSLEYSRHASYSSKEHYLNKTPFIQEMKDSGKLLPTKSKKRANIVLIMTDDLDVELGSLSYMPKLLRLLGDQGAMFSNSYTSTPMCCPSRSSMLTGMYIHNHEVYTNNQNCSSVLWQNTHEKRSFATYLKDAGYKTGFFGKYLNRYNGSHVPVGWSEWVGLIGNSRYYNYSVNRNHRLEKYGNRYPQDYFPHVITSDGLNYLRKQNSHDDPFLLVMSYPAPHGPEDSAPEHSHRFFNASDHHTASYNYAPNPDKQWILQWTDRMGAMEMKFTDLLMTKRLQTLQSVDESVAKIIYELQKMKALENTYVFFTSDHGYHLGQFGLAKGKSMPFEFDIKVPFFVIGPGIKPGTILPQISLNIDLAPTFLDIAGVTAPPHMDGRSLLRVLEDYPFNMASLKAWRDSFLVESSGRVREEDELLKKEQRSYEREKALSMSLNPPSINLAENGSEVPLFTSKHEKFQEVCKQEKFRPPCHGAQKWFCIKNGDRWRLKKCRNKSSVWRSRCICQSKFGFGTFNKLNPQERRRQKKFIKRYVSKNKHGFNGKFIQSFNQLKLPLPAKKRHNKHRNRHSRRFARSVDDISTAKPIRSVQNSMSSVTKTSKYNPSSLYKDDLIGENGLYANSSLDFGATSFDGLSEEETTHAFVAEEELRDLQNQIIDISDELRLLENITVNLNNEETHDLTTEPFVDKDCNINESLCYIATKDTFEMWKNRKLALNDHILRLKQQLSVIKDIYVHLQETQPIPELFSLDAVDEDRWKVKLNESNEPTENYNSLGSSFVLGKDAKLRQYFDKRGKKYIGRSEIEENLSTKNTHFSSIGNQDRKINLKKWASFSKRPKQHTSVGQSSFDVEGTKLRPIPLNYLLSDFSKYGNEAISPLCWCDERVFLKLELQKRRSQRRIERKKLKEERHKRRLARRQKKKEKLQWCAHPNLHCFAHDNNHWRTPPLWNDGSFCFCISASNNTYWCLRTITEERNFLYCEFITGLVTYYDLHIDPYQLRNVAFTLSNDEVLQLHSKLIRLRTCSGGHECHVAEQFHNDFQTERNKSTEISISSEVKSGSEPQNEVFLTKSFTKKNRNNKIKKLRRKLRRRLKKERKAMKNKYVAMLNLPESSLSRNPNYPRKSLRTANRRKRKRYRKQRRKRKSKRNRKNSPFP